MRSCASPLGFRPAGRRARSVLSSDGKNQRSPGDGSDERLRAAGAHSRLFPGPLFTREGHFGLLVTSGVLSFDRASLYSRPTGAYQSKIYRRADLTPPASCIPTCWVRRWSSGYLPQLPSFHSYARVGGFISAQCPPNFAHKGPKARGKWYHRSCLCPPGGHRNLPGRRPP